MRIIVVTKRVPHILPTVDWVDPVTEERASREQMLVIRDRLQAETYIHVPNVGICEPLEHRNTEAEANARMMELAAKHDRERFTLVFTVG